MSPPLVASQGEDIHALSPCPLRRSVQRTAGGAKDVVGRRCASGASG